MGTDEEGMVDAGTPAMHAARMAALIAAAIALNLVGGEIVRRLAIPVYGDSIGTVVAAALGGPWIGAATGAGSNILWAAMGVPNALPFALTAAVIGVLAGMLARYGWLRTAWRAALGGLLTGLVAAMVSAPIAAWLFGGVTGGGTDLLVAYFRSIGFSFLQAALGQSIVSDPIDKTVTFLIAFAILRALPGRLLARYPAASWTRGGSTK